MRHPTPSPRPTKNKLDFPVVAFALAVVAVTTFFLIAVVRQSSEFDAVSDHSPDTTAYTVEGAETVAVFLGSAACSFSMDPGLPGILAATRAALEAEARAEGKRFAFLGVSVDPTVDEGFRYLQRFQVFDELLVGRGWLNSGAIAFMIRDLVGDMKTPQLVVLEREVKLNADSLGITITPDRVISRYVGLEAIQGAPMVSQRTVEDNDADFGT
ncbi:MAG: hypothetical protein OXL34_06735 [Gemmatimonadota bacterium]|nr:hypothetical protein [Gemmatimonadota bacterium]